MSVSGPTLNIYVVHAKHLTTRRDRIKEVVKTIAGLYPHTVLPKFIGTSESVDLTSKLAELNPRMDYNPSGDKDFDQLINILNIEHISNIFKHIDAWKAISESPDDQQIHLVIEDDVTMFQEQQTNMKSVLDYVKESGTGTDTNTQWDIMFLGVANSVPDHTKITLQPIPKILPSKDAYFINKKTATRFLSEWTTAKMTHSLRVQLSKYLFTNKNEIKAVFPGLRATVEGSKIGFHPTSTNSTNILIFNTQYMEMFRIYIQCTSEADIKKHMNKLTELYMSLKNLNSPDVSHLYAQICEKSGQIEMAEEKLREAIDLTKKGQGLLNNRTALSVHVIAIYKKLQKDHTTTSKLPSKYAHPCTIPLKD